MPKDFIPMSPRTPWRLFLKSGLINKYYLVSSMPAYESCVYYSFRRSVSKFVGAKRHSHPWVRVWKGVKFINATPRHLPW